MKISCVGYDENGSGRHKFIGQVKDLRFSCSISSPIPIVDAVIASKSGFIGVSRLYDEIISHNKPRSPIAFFATLDKDAVSRDEKAYSESVDEEEKQDKEKSPTVTGVTKKTPITRSKSTSNKKALGILGYKENDHKNVFGDNVAFVVTNAQIMEDNKGIFSVRVRLYEASGYDLLLKNSVGFTVLAPKKQHNMLNLDEILKTISSDKIGLAGHDKHYGNVDCENVQYYPPHFSKYIVPPSSTLGNAVMELFNIYGYALVFDGSRYNGVDLVLNAAYYASKIEKATYSARKNMKGIKTFKDTPDEFFHSLLGSQIGLGVNGNIESSRSSNQAFGITNAMAFSRKSPFSGLGHDLFSRYGAEESKIKKNKIFDRYIYASNFNYLQDTYMSDNDRIKFLSSSTVGMPGATYMVYCDDCHSNEYNINDTAVDGDLVVFPNSDRILRWKLKQKSFKSHTAIDWKISRTHFPNAIFRSGIFSKAYKWLGQRSWFLSQVSNSDDKIQNRTQITVSSKKTIKNLKKSMMLNQRDIDVAYKPAYTTNKKFFQLINDANNLKIGKYIRDSDIDSYKLPKNGIETWNEGAFIENSIVGGVDIHIIFNSRNDIDSGILSFDFLNNIANFDNFMPKVINSSEADDNPSPDKDQNSPAKDTIEYNGNDQDDMEELGDNIDVISAPSEGNDDDDDDFLVANEGTHVAGEVNDGNEEKLKDSHRVKADGTLENDYNPKTGFPFGQNNSAEKAQVIGDDDDDEEEDI